MKECINQNIVGKCYISPALDGPEVFIPNLTKEDCSTTCQVRQMTFYGVENGENCYCGDSIVTTAAGTCNKACEGDTHELNCGGIDSTSVMPVINQGHCFVTNWSTTGDMDVLTAEVFPEVENLTPAKCAEDCSDIGKQFYGLHEKNCFCGDYVHFTAPGNCDEACEGDRSKICGGSDAINVFTVNNDASITFDISGSCTKARNAQKNVCSHFGIDSKAYAVSHHVCVTACLFKPAGCPNLDENCE